MELELSGQPGSKYLEHLSCDRHQMLEFSTNTEVSLSLPEEFMVSLETADRSPLDKQASRERDKSGKGLSVSLGSKVRASLRETHLS